MHNLQTRASTLLSTFFAGLCGILVLLTLYSLVVSTSPDGSVVVHDIRIVKNRYGPDYFDYKDSKSEFAVLNMDIDADFTSLFHWNTKQVYAAVMAEYTTPSHAVNKVILWDKLILNKKDARLKLRGVRNKYALIDINRRWNHLDANMSVYWDVSPHAGLLANSRSSGSQSITLN
ncbi:uncharacterized protein VTP21DRAFT_6024 [Calcarisporiella thermophila]|uniref:uncharacterized protein n=1 Tax=Calcarisporiella thermophila TaxID=911321 RepID=UPI0037425C8A